MDASGGIYSTTDGMVHWMQWHLAKNDTARMTLAHAKWRPHDGLKRAVGLNVSNTISMGLGWIIIPANEKVPTLPTL